MRIVLLLLVWSTVAMADSRVSVKPKAIVLSEPIYFEFGKGEIKSESHSLLDAVAAALAKNQKITLLEIGVHTDARGNDEWNLELSQKRAQAVVDYLVAKGVAAGRLRAKGYGEAKPIDKGTSAKAMARNRRTELTILQRTTT